MKETSTWRDILNMIYFKLKTSSNKTIKKQKLEDKRPAASVPLIHSNLENIYISIRIKFEFFPLKEVEHFWLKLSHQQ